MSRCPREGELRAYIDGEDLGWRAAEIGTHLSACARCAARLSLLRHSADTFSRHWQSLEAAVSPHSQAHVDRALTLWRVRVKTGGMYMKPSTRRVLRPVLGGLAATALLVAIFAFAPTRALARQVLSVFRVNRFAVIRVSPDEATLEQLGAQLQDKLFISEPQVLAHAEQLPVGGLDEARSLAGFDVRAPASWPEDGVQPAYSYVGRTTYSLRFTGEALRTVLAMADMDPDRVPRDMVEGEVIVDMPAAVQMHGLYIDILQVYKPEVRYPDEIDSRLMGEAGLRLMGLAPADARRISKSIDWTSTIVLPVPADVASFQEVQVAGVTGVLLTAQNAGAGIRETRILLWEKDDVVYVVSGPMGTESIAALAASMF